MTVVTALVTTLVTTLATPRGRSRVALV